MSRIMWKRCLIVVFVSVLVVASSAWREYNGKANAASRATVMAFQTTCSCGMDCAAGNCTFYCEGSAGGCFNCVNDCCRRETRRVCR